MIRHLTLALAGVVLATASPDVQAQQTPPPAATTTPPCPVSADPEFGRTPQKAIRIGGGAMYVAVRERRYLDGLRGPGGETLIYARRGTTAARTNGAPIDVYEVTYQGLEKPATLYLDAYHYEDAMAPVGFVCAENRLGPPPIDGFLANDLAVTLALQQGADRDFTPISLDADGSATHGVAFDRFRLMARDARAAKTAGTPLERDKLPARFMQRGLVIVAYPLTCADRTIAPSAIEIVPTQGPPVPRSAEAATLEALSPLLPGFTPKPGTIAAVFPLVALRPVDTVRITYAGEACPGGSSTVTLPVRMTGNRGVTMPQPTLPAGTAASSAPLWLQVVVDHDGLLQQASYLGGPESLLDLGLATLKNWRAEPARINMSPVISDSIVVLHFRH
jgi:hypothetical protein